MNGRLLQYPSEDHHPGEYTSSKSEIIAFHFKYISFSCSCCVFADNITESNLKSATFVTPTFTS